MKKLLLIVFCVPLIFSSCEKEDDSPNSNSNNNNPIGNTPSGVIGYYYNGYINKTTDSGVTWTVQGDYISGINQLNFVN